MRRTIMAFLAGGLVVLIVMLLMREKPGKSTANGGGAPAQGAMTGGQAGQMVVGVPGMANAAGPTDGAAIPLRMSGTNSAAQLGREAGKLNDPVLRANFENAYRLTFSARKEQRDYEGAKRLAGDVIFKDPDFAPAYRVQGYARFNTGDSGGALVSYNKAVELDPSYGEAQYALAILYVMSDVKAGKVHYQKAMELGIKDDLEIGNKYYGAGD